MLRIFLLIALGFAQPALSENEAPVPVPDQPEVPPKVQSGQPMEPDVTIIRRGQETIEEFRRDNRVYKVVVTPAIGPAYTLYDRDGDGNLDVRDSDLKTGLRINQWTLFSW
jgi:hypothetical protein